MIGREQIGRVAQLWRYPVKSMLGEKLPELAVGTGGVNGDRAWALREIATGRIASAKKWRELFEFRASYDLPPAPGRDAPVTIVLPDGRKIHAADADASEALSKAVRREVKLERAQSGSKETAGIDPATIFADVPVGQVIPGLTSETLPDYFGLNRGTFFDSAVIHVLASGTLEHLRLLGGFKSPLDPRRFRPNIYIETDGPAEGFLEDNWIGGTLEIGACLRIVTMQPALRCVMTTHPQEDLPRDYDILRMAARHHQTHVGVFASIGAGGAVCEGDPVYLVK